MPAQHLLMSRTLWATPADDRSELEIVQVAFGKYPDASIVKVSDTTDGTDRTDFKVDIPGAAWLVEVKDRYGYTMEFMEANGVRIGVRKADNLVRRAYEDNRKPILIWRTADLILIGIGRRIKQQRKVDGWTRFRNAEARGDKAEQAYEIPTSECKVWSPDWTQPAIARAKDGDLTLFARRVFIGGTMGVISDIG